MHTSGKIFEFNELHVIISKNYLQIRVKMNIKTLIQAIKIIKGILIDDEIAEFLNQYFADKKLKY